jgi:hypothetical protein
MPIRINLLEEEQKAKLARKRDPVMLAVRCSVLALVLIFAVSAILYSKERSLRAHLTGLKGEWERRQPKFVVTESDIKSFQKLVAKTELLRSQAESRFLWAPQLEMFKDAIPSTVQITRFVGHREVSIPAPVAGSKAPAPTPVEIVKVTLEGIVEGGRPELVVNDFLNQLKSNRRLADQVSEIKLMSLNRPQMTSRRTDQEAPSETAAARFVIEIQYRDKQIKRT